MAAVGTRVEHTGARPPGASADTSKLTCTFLPCSRPWGVLGPTNALQQGPPCDSGPGGRGHRPLTAPVPPPQPTSPSSGPRPSSCWCRQASGCSCRCSSCPSCRCSSGWTPPTAARCVVRPPRAWRARGRGRARGSLAGDGPALQWGPRAGPPGGWRAGHRALTRPAGSGLTLPPPPPRAHLQMVLEPKSRTGLSGWCTLCWSLQDFSLGRAGQPLRLPPLPHPHPHPQACVGISTRTRRTTSGPSAAWWRARPPPSPTPGRPRLPAPMPRTASRTLAPSAWKTVSAGLGALGSPRGPGGGRG